MAEKCTKAEYLSRVKQIETLLLNGETRANILEFGTERFGVSEHAVEYYITDAYKRITAINKATIDENRGWVLRNLIEVLRKARGASDLKVQLQALKQISEITGIEYSPAEQPERVPGMSDQQLDEAWQAEAVH